MEKVVLYSTKCPRCKVIAAKMEKKGIPFELKEDFDIEFLIEKGFKSAPVLAVGDNMMEFSAANDWINEQGED